MKWRKVCTFVGLCSPIKMASEGPSDLSETCDQLQSVQQQLKLIEERNAEILEHLSRAKSMMDEEGKKLPNDICKNISAAKQTTDKINSTIKQQCEVLSGTVEELRYTPKATTSSNNSETNQSSVHHQLRAQLDRNVELQRDKMKLEFKLAEKMEMIKLAAEKNNQLEEDLSGSNKSMEELVSSYEENAKKAENQLKKLQEDLDKSQQSAKEYQSLYDRTTEPKRTKSAKASAVGSQVKERPPSRTSLPHPTEIDDRYMAVLEENKSLKDEIQRLKTDNKYLVKKTKQQTTDIDKIQKHVVTCTAQRQEMQTRLKKQQNEYQKLTRCLNKQAAQWVAEKKYSQDMEENNRINTLGAS